MKMALSDKNRGGEIRKALWFMKGKNLGFKKFFTQWELNSFF